MLRNFKVTLIGVAVAFALLLMNPAISPISALNTKVCSSSIGFKYYDSSGIAESVKNSQIIAIGMINNVETKAVDWYQPVPQGKNGNYSAMDAVDFQNSGQKIPWKFVTLDVEKYLFDKTGKYSQQIVFRAPANQCVDKFGILSPEKDARPGATPEFHKQERALIEITDIKMDALYFDNGYKFDIAGDEIQPNEKIGLQTPISIEAFEAEISQMIGNQNFG